MIFGPKHGQFFKTSTTIFQSSFYTIVVDPNPELFGQIGSGSRKMVPAPVPVPYSTFLTRKFVCRIRLRLPTHFHRKSFNCFRSLKVLLQSHDTHLKIGQLLTLPCVRYGFGSEMTWKADPDQDADPQHRFTLLAHKTYSAQVLHTCFFFFFSPNFQSSALISFLQFQFQSSPLFLSLLLPYVPKNRDPLSWNTDDTLGDHC
jgi:hypothetical protein